MKIPTFHRYEHTNPFLSFGRQTKILNFHSLIMLTEMPTPLVNE